MTKSYGSIRIAPSLLAANFVRLEEEIHKIEKFVDILHIDVMDGHFVPNLTFGPPVIQSIRRVTSLELDVHLMVDNPKNIIRDVLKAGSDNVTFHCESADDNTLQNLIKMIRDSGTSVGISLNPDTPPDNIDKYMPHINRVLCMTVEPGYGGQSFRKDMIDKIRILRDSIQKLNPEVELEVDGGIDADTAPLVVNAGANILVAGSAIFKTPDPASSLQKIQNAVKNI